MHAYFISNLVEWLAVILTEMILSVAVSCVIAMSSYSVAFDGTLFARG